MRASRMILILLLIAAVLVNILYWRDPWLWRRFANTFLQLAGGTTRLLEPHELVAGDQSLELPVAEQDELTVKTEALESAVDFAARFDSYALIVAHKGVIQVESYADGWDRESLTQSQSMHKSLLALLIGVAIENGLIDSVDDPVNKYLPAWENDPRGSITLYELMIMSSGLAQYSFTLNPFTDDFRWLYSGDTVPVVLRTPQADWEPGQKFDYNNINAELLGLVLENAFGQRYAKILEQRVWLPMGGEEARVWLDHEGGNAFTSCCLMATARDWTRVGQLMLNRGAINGNRIVQPEWVIAMTTQSPVSRWYGLQTWLTDDELNPRSENLAAGGAYGRTEPFVADDTYYFSGRGGQRVFVVPSQQLVIVRLGPALGPNPLKPGWDNSYLVNSLIRGIKPDEIVPGDTAMPDTR